MSSLRRGQKEEAEREVSVCLGVCSVDTYGAHTHEYRLIGGGSPLVALCKKGGQRRRRRRRQLRFVYGQGWATHHVFVVLRA